MSADQKANMPPENEIYFLHERLLKNYYEISLRAHKTIRSGNVVDNPFLADTKEDTRWSIAALGPIINQPISTFLDQFSNKLAKLEPSVELIKPDSRHITLRELVYNKNRKNIDPQKAASYYCTLKEKLCSHLPIELELASIIPTIDREQNSVGVVAAFLPTNLEVVYVRQDITNALEEARLPLTSRLGEIKVILSTIGRFAHPPRSTGETFLSLVKSTNKQLSDLENRHASINHIEIIATTSLSYPNPEGHIHFSPTIDLDSSTRSSTPLSLLTPSQKRNLRK